jgi:hypothetical protein
MQNEKKPDKLPDDPCPKGPPTSDEEFSRDTWNYPPPGTTSPADPGTDYPWPRGGDDDDDQ